MSSGEGATKLLRAVLVWEEGGNQKPKEGGMWCAGVKSPNTILTTPRLGMSTKFRSSC